MSTFRCPVSFSIASGHGTDEPSFKVSLKHNMENIQLTEREREGVQEREREREREREGREDYRREACERDLP